MSFFSYFKIEYLTQILYRLEFQKSKHNPVHTFYAMKVLSSKRKKIQNYDIQFIHLLVWAKFNPYTVFLITRDQFCWMLRFMQMKLSWISNLQCLILLWIYCINVQNSNLQCYLNRKPYIWPTKRKNLTPLRPKFRPIYQKYECHYWQSCYFYAKPT